MIRALLAILVLAAPAAAQVTVSDDRGPQDFATPPERIVALSWNLAELLVELGIDPAGVADPEGYGTWVVQPALPEGTADAGLRNEPNLERIAELDPDLILAGDQQSDLVERLEAIAPVMVFEGFSAEHDNAGRSREIFRILAELTGETERAEERLAELDARIAAAGERVRAAYGDQMPPVLPIRLMTATSVRLHGANSLARAALEGMGLDAAGPEQPTDWGFVQRDVPELADYEEAIVLQIDPFPEADALYGSQLWRYMPFVQADRFATTEPAWTFGGAFSVGYLAEAFANALVELAQE